MSDQRPARKHQDQVQNQHKSAPATAGAAFGAVLPGTRSELLGINLSLFPVNLVHSTRFPAPEAASGPGQNPHRSRVITGQNDIPVGHFR
jgi:hypothetical protein